MSPEDAIRAWLLRSHDPSMPYTEIARRIGFKGAPSTLTERGQRHVKRGQTLTKMAPERLAQIRREGRGTAQRILKTVDGLLEWVQLSLSMLEPEERKEALHRLHALK